MIHRTLLAISLTICHFALAQFAYSQPANDNPCGAFVLEANIGSNCTPTDPLSWTDATGTGGFNPPACASYSGGDIWFMFTLAEPADIFITTVPGVGTGALTDGGMELFYQAIDCTNYPYLRILCDDDSGEGSMPQISIPAIGAGIYYVRFWDYNDKTSTHFGGICLAVNPVATDTPNDDPCTATSLALVDADECTPSAPVIWSNATGTSSIAIPECGTYKTGDLWFSYELTDTSDVVITTSAGTGPGAIIDAAIAIYTADSCDGKFTEVVCQNNQDSELMPAVAQLSSLPGKYYIRFWDVSDSLSGNIGGICVAAVPTIVIPTLNDDPCGALVLNTIADTSCIPDNPQFWTNATPTASLEDPSCGSYSRGDVWFQFVLSETSDILVTTVAGTSPGAISDGAMAIYVASDCSDPLFYMLCDDDAGPGSMPQIRQYAMPGGKYFIRFWDYEDKFSGNIGGICVAAVPTISTVANDNCLSAIAFPLLPADGSCASVSVNTIGATGLPLDMCQGITDDDVWYSFIVPAGVTQVGYSVTKNGNLYDAGKRMYELACDDHSTVQCMNDSEGIVDDLVGGQTYYIRTYSAEDDNGAQYDFCLRALIPPVNDDPCGALTLIPVEGVTNCQPDDPLSWEFASGSPVPDPDCGQYSNGDVWFKFELTYKADITIRTAEGTGLHGITDGAMALYQQGSDCNDLEKIICIDDSSTTVLMPYIHFYSLIPGTYYIRFWEYTGAISGDLGGICIASVPTISILENDICDGAFPFPPVPTDGTCASVNVNTANATGDLQDEVWGHNDDDLWYSFVVPAGVTKLLYEVTTNSGNIQHIVCLYNQCNFESEPIQCTDFDLHENGSFSNLVEGATYFIRTYTGELNVKSDYNICLKTPPSVSNDECFNALPFPSISSDGTCSTVQINTTWATSSGGYPCGDGANDIWYSFVVPDGVTDIVGEFFSIGRYDSEGFEVFEGDCGNLVSIFCVDDRDFQSSRVNGLTSGGTYYLRVFTTDSRLFEFGFCLRAAFPPPVNDHCEGAIPFPPIPEDGSCATMIADLKGASLDGPHDCYLVEGFDIWYSFVLPVGHDGIIIRTTNIGESGSVGVTLYEGDCTFPVFIGCQGDLAYNFQGLTGGQTYLARAHSFFANVELSFEICIAVAPPSPIHAECEGAIPFPVIPTNGDWVGIEGTTLSGTDSDLEACNGTDDDDVWYSFVVPDGFTELLFRWYGDGYPTIELFEGDCDNLIFLNCYGTSNSDGAILNLIPGDTYRIRVYDPTEFEYTEFSVELSVPFPITNDLCPDAIPFPLIPTDGSCATMKADLVYVTNSGDLNCQGHIQPDTWFTFTVPDGYNSLVLSSELVYGWTPEVQIFSGDCNSLVAERCLTFPEYPTAIPGLEGGETYYMQVLEYGGPSGVIFCLTVGALPPLNDNCSGAYSITTPEGLFVDPGPQSTTGATSTEMEPCFPYGGENPYDVWYSITTDADGGDATIRLDFTEPSFTVFDFYGMMLSAFEGNCGEFELLGCVENQTNVSGYNDTFVVMTIHALAPATTYYFRVHPIFNYGEVNFTLFAEGTALSPTVGSYNPADEQDKLDITKIFPSPANAQIGIEFNTHKSGTARLWITDILGHVALHKDLNCNTGPNRTSMMIDQLAPGVYIINLENNGVVSEGKRFVKSDN
ncbi:MAG TPA: T9SS type A sorting domain-containing protein [Saprospiraceae bacterium]|nr:T9SS type A sorting domain-containing protein [Saprospiraceae bacterium]